MGVNCNSYRGPTEVDEQGAGVSVVDTSGENGNVHPRVCAAVQEL
jgi:hypothetical protein